jgi:CubicO group peptidase (beta-lactamase class C family)
LIRSGLSTVYVTAVLLVGHQPATANDAPWVAGIRNYVGQYLDMAAFDGVVLIAEGDRVVYHEAFGFSDCETLTPLTNTAVFRIASLSKQFTQAAIGRLVDANALTLDSPLSEFLPDYPNAEQITIRQLLDHTAGIPHTNRLDWMDMTVPLALDAIVDGLSQEPLSFPPGTDSQYSNGGYALLAKVIEVASGESYESFLAQAFGDDYPSIGHESPGENVPDMAARYAPGPVYGDRVAAETYLVSNRIGGGSLHANAMDVYRLFWASYEGRLLDEETTAALFPPPDDGDISITGRSPGALAQVYLDVEDDLTVVTLSSNSGWPGSFNSDIVGLYRGEEPGLTPFEISNESPSGHDIAAITGRFVADRFGWAVAVEQHGDGFVFVQDRVRTAFARTKDGEFHLPIYDWLCRYGGDGMEFVCRQRDPEASIRFRFVRS